MSGGLLRRLGPALIVGSVVLGPGSLLTASRVGCDFGFELAWVVVTATVLMAAMTALSAHLGATLDGTPCEVLARRAGRPVAALVGLVLFGVVACFQFSNNLGVLAGLEPLGIPAGKASVAALCGLNALVAAALLGFRELYRPLERAMKALVGLMILAFVGNLVMARPSPGAFLAGLVPSLPTGDLHGSLLPVTGMIGTTFSVAGAFYTAYLVRARGWKGEHARERTFDSLVSIGVLGGLSLVVLATAATGLHGRVAGDELTGAAEVARMLEPLFGAGAVALFSIGLLAAAFSSFLGNVLIGGTVLSDGLGLGGEVDGKWTRLFTVAALAIGLGVALLVQRTGQSPVRLILFAQALTVLGNPLLAGVLLWLASRGPREARPPLWTRLLAWTGFVLVVGLAARTASRLL
ncbi:MAG: divalent metal cation transporter [Planctomycetota bacterium]|nr:divalent metal cation transporter [Planctomycetota bacterium]